MQDATGCKATYDLVGSYHKPIIVNSLSHLAAIVITPESTFYENKIFTFLFNRYVFADVLQEIGSKIASF